MAKWSIPPIRVKGLLDEQMHQAARAIALALFSRMIVLSPVDTGRFRGNWQIDIEDPALIALERFDKAGQQTILAEAAKLINYKIGATIRMRNNVPYAVRLEYGWSKQAPQGVVRVTILEAPAIAAKVAAGLRARQG